MATKKTTNDASSEFETKLAGKQLTIEVGRLAQQSNSSCVVRLGDTVVLATAVMASRPREGVDFFPLMVDYEERLYAAGKIKGSRWIKREGRPSDEAVLTSRLVDRAIRPLFPKELKHDVQVILTVLSFDGENDADVISLIAASTVLAISDIPWDGPIGGARVGKISSSDDERESEWVLNPTFAARAKSELDLIIAGTEEKTIMLEADANEVSEEEVFQGIEFAQKHIKIIMSLIGTVVKEVGKKKVMPQAADAEDETETPESHKELIEMTKKWVFDNAQKELFSKDLQSKTSRKAVVAQLGEQMGKYLKKQGVGKERRKKAQQLFKELIEQVVSQQILAEEKRVDGRKLNEVRELQVETGLLPRTHGSALFARGETQILSVVTLGAPGEEQFLESMEETGKKRYMHHYNFPPFSVGEVGFMRSPGRREIGHGALAERALVPVLPAKEEFPYTIRVVSEVLSSNGSSSMASVCGSSLALMDAGVPIKKAVAGVAMGLASDEEGSYKILTDLQDLEDGPGGMDFKVAGTVDGITVIQMDTKTQGLTNKIVAETLKQAKEGRLNILEATNAVIAEPHAELSPYAPRVVVLQINPEKIRDVIGPGGKVINEIIDKTGVHIDIEPDGTVMVTSTDEEGAQKAIDWIKNLTREIQVGEVFQGKVSRIFDFGAIVEITPNQDGLVHISELAPYRVKSVEDVVKIGDIVSVKVMGVEENGRINLSMKATNPEQGDSRPSSPRPHRPDNSGRRNHYQKKHQ